MAASRPINPGIALCCTLLPARSRVSKGTDVYQPSQDAPPSPISPPHRSVYDSSRSQALQQHEYLYQPNLRHPCRLVATDDVGQCHGPADDCQLQPGEYDYASHSALETDTDEDAATSNRFLRQLGFIVQRRLALVRCFIASLIQQTDVQGRDRSSRCHPRQSRGR